MKTDIKTEVLRLRLIFLVLLFTCLAVYLTVIMTTIRK